MRNLSKRDPRELANARDTKQAKVGMLREALDRPGVSPELAQAWERTIERIEADIRQINTHLASLAN